MLKRLFTPLTLVNQLALIVLLATIIGVAGMAISARLVNGVQGSAHAINKAGSLRMQSYRLLAAIPLNENDQKLVADMTATVFSPELQNSARRDGREIQLKALQQYWQLALAPGCSAQSIRRKWPRCRRLCRSYRPVGHRIRPHHRAAYRTGGLDPSHPRHWYGAAADLHYHLATRPPAAAVETAAEHGARGEPA